MFGKLRPLLILCTTYLINKLSEFELYLNSFRVNSNPNGYEDLTPINNSDEDKKYSAALEWSLENKNIKNIALTGAYGSGKSSIIRTFQKEYRGYHYLNISLASFTDNTIKQGDPELANDSENIYKNIDRLIELSILQQMFYHVRHKQIPDSRFKRIKSIGEKGLLFKTLFITVWILALILFFKPKIIQDTGIWQQLDLSSPIITYLSSSIIIIGIGMMIAKSIRIANNSKLNKLNVQSGEIEINKDIDSSILNKHLDEILYFFEVTDYNVVIIEDLDRFNNTEIYTKLRELNVLINSSLQINRRVVFLYAIKDNMFHDKNRTKFFDFIIPVIPVINTSNSGGMLHQILKQGDSQGENKLSTDFIDDVSMYIDDMRLLKNICNEYTVYKCKLNPKLNPNYLLAMIIYKNLYPSDFVDLHNGKGKVCDIFTSKAALIKGKIDEIEKEIKKCRENIEALEKVSFKDIQELRALYIQSIVEENPEAISLLLNGNQCSFKKCKDDENFELLKQSHPITYYYHITHYNQLFTANASDSFKDLENNVDSEMTYEEREQLITDRDNGKIENLKKRIEELKKEKNDIKYWTLQQIAENIDATTSFEKIKDDKLIIYLIRNGYINENYHDYISYFHEGLMTKDDKEFLFSIRNREFLPFNFKLTKIENLIKKIRPKEFESKEVLNYSLIDYVLPKRHEYDGQWNMILKQLCNKSKTSISFIDGFLDNGLHIDLLITDICKTWTTFWDFIVLESGYSDEKKDKYLKLQIEYLDISAIKKQNANRNIADYLQHKKNFINVFDNEPKIQEALKSLNIKFENLDISGSTNQLFDFIYENNLYKINKEMIALFIGEKSSLENKEKLNNANYTTIKTSGCTQTINYIDTNLNEYISNVCLSIPENTQESEELVVELLCKEEDAISLVNRKKIIEKQDCIISNIESLNQMEHSLIELIIQKSKMKATWANIICYYELKAEAIDDVLVSFLNREHNYKELAKIKLNKENKTALKFINSFIINENISDNGFESLLLCCPYVYTELDFNNLSDKKVDLMIKHGYLQLSADRFNYLKDNFDKHLNLLRKYPQKFIETQAEYALESNEINILLNSHEFNHQQKISIIQNTNNDLIIGNEELSNSVCNVLSLNEYIELDFGLLKSLLQYGRSIENRLKLFVLQIHKLNSEQIAELLNVLGEPYSDIAINGKRPLLPKNQLNFDLVNNLHVKDYISSFKQKDDKIRVNTKQS
nr:hypothetical protein [uncultured Bacteroides sp.]